MAHNIYLPTTAGVYASAMAEHHDAFAPIGQTVLQGLIDETLTRIGALRGNRSTA